MAIITGIGGAIDGVPTISKWSVTHKADVQALGHSGTSGAMDRIAGNKDWSGSYTQYLHTPTRMPGNIAALTASIDGTKGVTGSIIIDQVEIAVDIEGGKPIICTTQFSGNGALILGAAVGADATVVTPFSSIGCKLQTGTLIATPVWTELVDVRTMTLTISRANKNYVDSATAGFNKRLAGPWDASLSASIYPDVDLSLIPSLNVPVGLRMFVSATLYWEILWGMLADIGSIEADRETAAIVGATLNYQFSAVEEIAAAATLGHIKTPAAATVWP
jgi:hypothetical protein